jgi:hypothetical protein
VASVPTRIYLTGGATAVLEGWRASTVDIDLRLEPDIDSLLREFYDAIEPELFRYPAIDPGAFRRKVSAALL